MKASPQSQGKGDAQGYFAGKGRGKGKDGETAGEGPQVKFFCWDFQEGKCTRENCKFLHEIDDRPLCWYFQAGNCWSGWKCRFRHAKEGSGKDGSDYEGAEYPSETQ